MLGATPETTVTLSSKAVGMVRSSAPASGSPATSNGGDTSPAGARGHQPEGEGRGSGRMRKRPSGSGGHRNRLADDGNPVAGRPASRPRAAAGLRRRGPRKGEERKAAKAAIEAADFGVHEKKTSILTGARTDAGSNSVFPPHSRRSGRASTSRNGDRGLGLFVQTADQHADRRADQGRGRVAEPVRAAGRGVQLASEETEGAARQAVRTRGEEQEASRAGGPARRTGRGESTSSAMTSRSPLPSRAPSTQTTTPGSPGRARSPRDRAASRIVGQNAAQRRARWRTGAAARPPPPGARRRSAGGCGRRGWGTPAPGR